METGVQKKQRNENFQAQRGRRERVSGADKSKQ